MASPNDDTKVDQEVLDILEKESKEFDKVSRLRTADTISLT
jgi:hypothetical protein